jgi:hypothetical protein
MSKKMEKRIHKDEYTSPKWYEDQLAQDWYIHDAQGDYLIMRRMSENGYGDITPQQASIMKYATIWELDRNQIRILVGKEIPNWNELRKQPLEEYKEWLASKTD